MQRSEQMILKDDHEVEYRFDSFSSDDLSKSGSDTLLLLLDPLDNEELSNLSTAQKLHTRSAS